MIVIIDANVIVSNPHLRGSLWEQVSEAVAGGRLEVLMPQFAFNEAIAVYQRRRAAKKIEIQSSARHTSQAVGLILKQAQELVDREAEDYPDLLKETLRRAGVQLLDPPRVGHEALVAKATSRRRPFDDSGTGYRDALHWATVLEVVEARYEASDIVFVSADRKAFGATGNDSRALHAHLLEDLKVYDAKPPYFRWLRSLEEFTVPGVFEDELKYQITLTPGEVAGFVWSSLWDGASLELLPRHLGMLQEPAAVVLLDVLEPSVGEVAVRQYFDEERFRADFDLHVSFEVALRYVPHVENDEVREETRTISLTAAAHADFVFGFRSTEYSFSNLELEDVRPAADPNEPAKRREARPTYANGPILQTLSSASVAVRAQATPT